MGENLSGTEKRMQEENVCIRDCVKFCIKAACGELLFSLCLSCGELLFSLCLSCGELLFNLCLLV